MVDNLLLLHHSIYKSTFIVTKGKRQNIIANNFFFCFGRKLSLILLTIPYHQYEGLEFRISWDPLIIINNSPFFFF